MLRPGQVNFSLLKGQPVSAMKLSGVLIMRNNFALAGWYGGHKALALSLIEACTEQLTIYPGGKGMDPTPWLALCDLTDECGLSSILREEVQLHFGHPSPSLS